MRLLTKLIIFIKKILNSIKNIKYEIERRLHRVKIELVKKVVRCPISKKCDIPENSYRCNIFYQKCTKFIEFNPKAKLHN